MPALPGQNLGIKFGWLERESGYGADMNDNLECLDVLVQASALDKDSGDPPVSPSAGDVYIIGSPATGAWVGQENRITRYTGTGWSFWQPKAGWLLYLVDEDQFYYFTGTVWSVTSLVP